MRRKTWITQVSLALILAGLALGHQSGGGQEPTMPETLGPPVASVTLARRTPALDQIVPEEQAGVVRDALRSLWQYVPNLDALRPQPRQIQAENGLIAYAGTDGHVYVMNPNGAAQTPVVTDLENVAALEWSPDDRHLAFAADGDGGRCLYLLQYSNRIRTTLTCGYYQIWEPRWSSDGSYLAFFGRQVADERLRAWIVPAGGGAAAVEIAPALDEIWSPDWLDNDTAVFAAETTESIWHIYRVDANQPTQPTAITPDITCLGTCACDESAELAAYPVLSPDGSWVAYIGGRSEGDKNSCTAYYAAYLVDPDGTSLPRKVADVADSTGAGVASADSMRWSPDNQHVGLPAGGSDNVLRLTTVDTGNGRVTTLHGREGGGWSGWDWAPDGTLMAAGYVPLGNDPEVVTADISYPYFFTSLVSGGAPAWSVRELLPEPFLDLPFGYSCAQEEYWDHFGGATDAEFRRAVSYNRAAREVALPCDRSGRINAFFDHQDPLYPYDWQPLYEFGCERTGYGIDTTVVTYEGQAFDEGSQENQRWYSGHPGYDFSTYTGDDQQTPVFAAAAGSLDLVGAVSGANTVQLRHELPGGLVYYTTYMHLVEDQWFSEIAALSKGAEISAGRRIGTMDSTGISFGNHLHFEVQQEIDGQRIPVDPTGFQPSNDFPMDPWTEEFTDACNVRHTSGVESYYLWVHSLDDSQEIPTRGQGVRMELPSQDVRVDLPTDAVPGPGIASLIAVPDPAPGVSLAGAGHAFSLRVRGIDAVFLEGFLTGVTVHVFYAPEEVADLVPETVSLYRWNRDATAWQQVPTSVSGGALSGIAGIAYTATSTITQTGSYALLGVPAEDLVAPQTVITITGMVMPPGPYYTGTVTIEAAASDLGGSGLERTEYSLDHGSTWQTHVAPLVFSPPYRLEIWVRSVDAMGNIEYPAKGAMIWYEGDRPKPVFLPLVARDSTS